MEHLIEPQLLDRRVRVHLVGVGGNGAQMAACLARLDIAMRALGHPGGLHVTAFDGDAVSTANVGRQLYSPSDVGQNKALLTIHRLNLFYGLDWAARPWRYEEAGRGSDGPDIVVSCVDSRAARRTVHRSLLFPTSSTNYWLDLGNTESTAQAILGEPARSIGKRRAGGPRLPCVTDLFPELLNEAVKEDNTPSCSVRMSLASQGLFVNDVVVRFAAQLLYELFSRGKLSAHGVVINLASKRSAPIDINPDVWRRYGFGPEQPKAPKRPAGVRKAKAKEVLHA
jgi:PRTRC genetic system ThiF family protein